jgi:hypothetical protein
MSDPREAGRAGVGPRVQEMRTSVIHRALIVSSLLAVGSVAWAQQADPKPPDPVKPQVQTMEMVLRTAVQTGSQNFAQLASKIAPSVVITPGEPATVTGVAAHNGDETLYLFHVQVPLLWQTSVQMMNLYLNRGQGQRSGGPETVADRGTISAATPPADPMAASPAVSTFDPERQYSIQVRDALVDALLDNSGVLPVGTGDLLVITAAGADEIGTNPLYRPTTNKLVLQIRGADLADLRQGRISREEARRRIVESHF